MIKSKFIVVEHHAIKARLHFDLRFKMPNSKIWMSFAVRKGVPLNPGIKVLAVKTHDHTEEEALFLGHIEKGYGAGELKKWDDGECDIIKYGTGHITINFRGHKVKGVYHLVSTGVIDRDYKRQTYILFKGKDQLGEMIIHGKFKKQDHHEADEGEGDKLSWSLPETYDCPKDYTFNHMTKKCVKNQYDEEVDQKNSIVDDIRPSGVGGAMGENNHLENLLWSLQPTFDCPEGYVYNFLKKKCVEDAKEPKGKSLPWSIAHHFKCPDEQTYDFHSGKCRQDPYDEELDDEGLNRLFRAALDN
jgi:DNA ligase D-like protein (predicted 3'-phosphoesterase)